MSKAWKRQRFHSATAIAAMAVILAIGLRACGPPPPGAHAPPAATAPIAPPPPPPIPPLASAPPAIQSCDQGPSDAARENVEGLKTLAFAPFGRAETGWEIYAPLVAHEIGAQCDAGSPAFAGNLAAWQSAHGLRGSGVLDVATFAALKAAWQARRPFVAANRQGCPAPPPESSLATVPADQSYGGKIMQLRPAALAAYGRMLAATRAETPEIRADSRLMTLFSAYRSPAYDAARCARDNNCQGIVRASCSPHRTGLAMDIYLGAAPGHGPDSSDDANRLFITKGAAYRWMVANAGRFGFAPYAFEPWHWEWTGEPI